MYVPVTPSPIRQIAIGAGISLAAFALFNLLSTGCGASLSSAVIACKLDALKILPDDPRMVTPYDAVDLINRLKACHNVTDAGAP